MSTTTKNYQILQKLEGEGNYLKLHPETNAEQVITSGGSNVQAELNGKYDVKKYNIENDSYVVEGVNAFLNYLNEVGFDISKHLGKICRFRYVDTDKLIYDFIVIPTFYDMEGVLICNTGIYRLYMLDNTYYADKYARENDVYTKYESDKKYLPLAGGTITGNINVSSTHGLMQRNYGWGFNDEGLPCVNAPDRTILISTQGLDQDYDYYTFPHKSGTVALLEDVNKKANSTDVYTKQESDAKYPSLSNGIIPQSYLPSYVDDVVEYTAKSSFPATGETGKIYVDKTTNLTWRWSGSAYVEISPSLAIGETSSTAYAGNKGKILEETVTSMQTDIGANSSQIVGIKSGTIAAGKAKALDHDIDIYIDSNTLVGCDEISNFSGSELHLNVELKTTGIKKDAYSCVEVDEYGRVMVGNQIVEVGTTGQTTPSSTLAIGGIFFKEI